MDGASILIAFTCTQFLDLMRAKARWPGNKHVAVGVIEYGETIRNIRRAALQRRCEMKCLSLLMLCCTLVGCGNAAREAGRRTTTTTTETAKSDSSFDTTAGEQMHRTAQSASVVEKPLTAADPGTQRSTAADERKIIYTAEVTLVTDDFGAAEQGVPKLIKQHGGYISEGAVERTSGASRSGRWVARVPVDRFDAFLDALSTLGVPEHRSQRAQEVTEEYVDLQSRIATQRRLEERILKLLEDRGGNIEDTIRMENELSRIRGEAERMEGRLRYLTDRTSLTTVTINVREEQSYTPPEAPEFAQRLSEGFSDSIDSMTDTGQNLAVVGARAVPWLVVVAIVLIPAMLLGGRRWRARRSSRE